MTYLGAEPGSSLATQEASHPRKLDCVEAAHLGYAPLAVEAGSSTAGSCAGLLEKRSAAQLLYDSFTLPAPAGTRSIAMRVRQMLYRAEPYQIDIQVEVQPERNRLIVTGQLIDVGHPDLLDAGIEVTLSDGRGNIINTSTSQFGEFRGEVILSGDLEVSFVGRDGKPVVVLLRGTLDPTSRGKN